MDSTPQDNSHSQVGQPHQALLNSMTSNTN
jgi:hypothetical protein